MKGSIILLFLICNWVSLFSQKKCNCSIDWYGIEFKSAYEICFISRDEFVLKRGGYDWNRSEFEFSKFDTIRIKHSKIYYKKYGRYFLLISTDDVIDSSKRYYHLNYYGKKDSLTLWMFYTEIIPDTIIIKEDSKIYRFKTYKVTKIINTKDIEVELLQPFDTGNHNFMASYYINEYGILSKIFSEGDINFSEAIYSDHCKRYRKKMRRIMKQLIKNSAQLIR